MSLFAAYLSKKLPIHLTSTLKEFRARVDFTSDHLNDQLSEYQHNYNRDRIHCSLGKTPLDRETELSRQTPKSEVTT